MTLWVREECSLSAERRVRGPDLGPQQSKQAARKRRVPAVLPAVVTLPLGQLLSLPGVSAAGSLSWTSLSQLSEKVGDTLPLEQRGWLGLEK